MSKLFNEPTYNIYLIGPPGSGKSSFVNSCYHLLNSSSKVEREIACVGGTMDHCTLVCKRYRLFDLQTKEMTNTRLFDTCGLEDDDASFPMLLKGRVKIGTNEIVNPIPRSSPESIHPNCIILFIPAADIIAGSANVHSYTKRVQQIKCDIVGVCVFITKVDEVNKSVCTKITNRDCDDLIQKAADILKLNKESIVPLVNYTNETRKSLLVDLWIFRALKLALIESHSSKILNKLNM